MVTGSGEVRNATALLDKLAAVVGERHVARDQSDMAGWLTDWRGRYTGQALAIVSPGSTAEVAEVVRLCAEHQVPIVTQGGNSGMVGGATPDASGRQLLLSTRRLTELEIAAETRTAVCGAGVVLQTLHEAAAASNLRFPLTLGGKGSATIGGLVSTNAGGTQVLRHGTMRALTLGLRAVLPDGQILDASGALKKDNRGFDLKQLFIGSEGTLGIVTEATLKLAPAVQERVTAWVGLKNLADARRLLLMCEVAAGDALEGFEVLPQACLDAVVDYVPEARSPLVGRHEWHALLEFVASDNRAGEQLRSIAEDCLTNAMKKNVCQDAVLASSEAQADAFWALREAIAPAEKARGPAVQHDIAVAPEAMPEMVQRLTSDVEARFPGTGVRAFGHLGDGNIHFHAVAPQGASSEWATTVSPEISTFIYDRVTEAGGSISAEHGIGQDKLAVLARTHDPVALHLMRTVKQALDPAGLLNPGKLVPLAPPSANP